MYFWQDYHRGDKSFIFVHNIRRHIGYICLISGSGNFDHSVKVLSARFLHYTVTVFLIVIGKYLVGRYIKIIQVSSYSSHFHTLALPSIGDFCWNQLLFWWLPKSNILIPSFFLWLLIGFLMWEKLFFLTHFMCLLIYSSIYVSID